MNPNAKFRKSFTISSRLSRTLKIQYNDHNTELPTARKTPVAFVFLNPLNPPCDEIKNTPIKLIKRASKLIQPIFCFNNGTESKAKVIGQIIFNGCATCAGKSEYA